MVAQKNVQNFSNIDTVKKSVELPLKHCLVEKTTRLVQMGEQWCLAPT